MKPSLILRITLVVIAGIVGWFAGRRFSVHPISHPGTSPLSAEFHSVASDSSNGSSSPPSASPSGDKASLKEMDRIFGLQRKAIAQLRGMKPNQLIAYINKIEGIANQYERRSMRELAYMRWLELDPEGAIALGKTRQDGTQMENILRAWANVDAAKALEWAKGTKDGDPFEEDIRGMMREIAYQDPAAFLKTYSTLPSHVTGTYTLMQSFQELHRQDPAIASELLDQMKTKWSKGNGAFGYAWGLATESPDKALEWGLKQTDPQQKGAALRAAIACIAGTDVDRALALYKEHDQALRGTEGFKCSEEITKKLSLRNWKEGFDFVMSSISADQHDRYLRLSVAPNMKNATAADWAMVLNASEKVRSSLSVEMADPEAGFFEAAKLPDSDGKTALMEKLAMRLAETEPLKALEIAKSTGEAGLKALGEKAAETLIENGDHTGFLNAIAHLSDKDQSQLISTMTEKLGDASPSKLLEFVSQLPAPLQKNARIQAANNLASFHPASAAEWVAQQPQEEQARLMSIVANEWGRQDTLELSQWVSTLDSGPQKDGAIYGLVTALSREEPDSALVWANSISSTAPRESAILNTIAHWFRRDPGAAMSAAESINVSAPMKEKLYNWMKAQGGAE